MVVVNEGGEDESLDDVAVGVGKTRPRVKWVGRGHVIWITIGNLTPWRSEKHQKWSTLRTYSYFNEVIAHIEAIYVGDVEDLLI